MRLLLLLIYGTISLASTLLPAQAVFPVKQQGLWGLMDDRGQLLLSPTYDLIGNPDEYGYLVAQKGDFLGLLGPGGSQILPVRYNDIQVLDASIIAVLEGGNWRVINRSGETILAGAYQQLRPLGKGLLAFRKPTGWGVIRQDGRQLIQPAFDAVDLLANGYFQTTLNGKLGLIHPEGQSILAANAQEISFDTIGIILYRQRGGWGGVNLQGQALFAPKYQNYSRLGTQHLLLTNAGEQVVYSHACRRTFKIELGTELLTFSNNYLMIRRQGQVGLLGGCGNPVLRIAYEEVQPFTAALFRVRLNGVWGLLGVNDQEILPFAYGYIAPLDGRIAAVQANAMFGVVNFKGQLLVKPEFARLEIEPNLVRAYPEASNGSNLNTYYIDENGQLSGSGQSNTHFRIRVAGPAGGSTPGTNDFAEYSNRVLPKFEWFYEALSRRWGLRSRRDGEVIIPPTFNEIEVLPHLGLTIVGLPKNTELTLERTTFRANSVFGLLLNDEGILVTELNLLDIRTEDWQKGSGVARCLFENGRFGLLDRQGRIVRRDLAYVGDFSGGLAPVSIQGKITATLEPKANHLPSLPDFLQKIRTGIYLLDYTAYDQQFSREAFLECGNCTWGYIDQKGGLVIPPRFYFAHPFLDRRAVVETERGAGIINPRGEFVIRPDNGSVERLSRADKTTYRLRKQLRQFGLIDTLGSLLIPPDYQALGTLSEGLVPVKTSGRWGYVNVLGEEVIEPVFLDAGPMSGGLARVKTGQGWTFIDPSGEVRSNTFYSGLGNFNAGLAWASMGNQVGYIDSNDRFVIPIQFDHAYDFEGGAARVVQDGKYGLIDRSGNWLLRPKYAKIEAFQPNGLAIVRLVGTQDRFGIIDQTGRQLGNSSYRQIGAFREGRALVKNQSGFGFIDELGREVIPTVWGYATSFSEGRAVVQENGRCGYIDLSGNLVVPCKYSRCLDFSDSRAVVYRSIRNAGLINPAGEELISPSLDRMIHFREGRGLMRDDEQGFYFITDKAALYDGYFDEARPFFHGVAAIRQGAAWGLINRKSLPLIRPKFSRLEPFQNGFAQVEIASRYGLADANGKQILPPDYAYAATVSPELIRVEKGNQVGYISTEGHWIWPLSE